VVEYNKADLAKASPTPTVTNNSPSLSDPSTGLAFDPSGNLWVTAYGDDAVEFTKAQLAKSGSPTARVTISTDGLSSPGDVAFNSSGDL
jgi:hypothetical protein